MKIEKLNRSKTENGKDEEKIQFGEKTLVCFACGHKINDATKKCPYCGTKI
ncbi:MAG: zinc-ribbon domain-containing protein [Promethearchaeota archaeon]|nr:MAG: zinc-ribbon domain-containing protein [Candidatus Lokiarchaeota archaeon]